MTTVRGERAGIRLARLTRAARAAVAALAVSAGCLLVGAAPAWASDGGSFSSPGSSSATSPLSSPPAIIGDVTVDGCINHIDLAVTGPDPATTTLPGPGNGANSQHIDWHPPFPDNGQYHVKATTHYDSSPLCAGVGGNTDATFTLDKDFWLAVVPATPTGVTATVDNQRQVTVKWRANTEPDLLGYAVYRVAKTGSSPCRAPASGDLRGPAGGATFTEAFGAVEPGGNFCYTVQALRKGAASGQGVLSGISAPATVTVPPPPPSPTTAPPAGATPGTSAAPGGGTGAGAPGSGSSPGAPNTSGLALAQSGKVDLSNFATQLDQAKRLPGPALPGPLEAPGAKAGPDVFNQTLPFGVTPGANDKEDGAGESATGPGRSPLHGSDVTARVRTLGTFAGGLIATVVLGHLLVLRQEMNRPPSLEVTEPRPG